MIHRLYSIKPGLQTSIPLAVGRKRFTSIPFDITVTAASAPHVEEDYVVPHLAIVEKDEGPTGSKVALYYQASAVRYRVRMDRSYLVGYSKDQLLPDDLSFSNGYIVQKLTPSSIYYEGPFYVSHSYTSRWGDSEIAFSFRMRASIDYGLVSAGDYLVVTGDDHITFTLQVN